MTKDTPVRVECNSGDREAEEDYSDVWIDLKAIRSEPQCSEDQSVKSEDYVASPTPAKVVTWSKIETTAQAIETKDAEADIKCNTAKSDFCKKTEPIMKWGDMDKF